jgi:lipase chaperone LimK
MTQVVARDAVRNRVVFAVCWVAITVIAVLWLRSESSRTTTAAPQSAAAISESQRSPGAEPLGNSAASVSASPPRSLPTGTATTDPTGTFRTDATGKLIIDEQTRLNMEALLARTDPGELPNIQQTITQNLPSEAAAAASALLDRYQNYSKAQRQAYPPGEAPATEEAALAELDGLHSLRVAHFGSDTAQALYGTEEALTRSLIELMRLEKDQSLTMEEKAARAQQLYDTLPELSRVQRSD